MDEVTPESAVENLTIDGSDGNPLYTLIDSLIDGGALELFSAAPYWRLPQKDFDSKKVTSLGEKFGNRKIIQLKVDEDFLRVAEISCSDFQRPITEVFPEQSEMGKRQHNRYLMGKEARPVGVISHGKWSTDQCREIDCYSIASDSTVTASSGISASYIPKPETIVDAEGNTAVSVEDAIPLVLIPALEWLIAARAFGARGDANHSAICQQNAQNLLV